MTAIYCWDVQKDSHPRMLNPLTLAFVGDAAYESVVREYILKGGERRAGELHSMAVRYVSATAQSMCYERLLEALSEEEGDILRRGRNATNGHSPKSSSVIEYRRATAVEALIGYLYLLGDMARINELVALMIGHIDKLTASEESLECIETT